MRLSRVQLLKPSTTSPEPGIYVTGEDVVGTSFMKLVPANAMAIQNATLKEQNVTHQGYGRANALWKSAEVNDVVQYGDRQLRIVTVRDAGEIDSQWLYFELEEKSLQEVASG